MIFQHALLLGAGVLANHYDIARSVSSCLLQHGQPVRKELLPWVEEGPIDVALTAVLTGGVDKQLGYTWTADDNSLGSWRQAVRHFKLKGVVMHDGGFSTEFIKKSEDKYVSFFNANQSNFYQRSDWRREWTGLTINDERFFVAGAFLEAHKEQLGYVLLTDARDVTFGRDPFKLMRAMDSAMNTTYIFVQDEWRPNQNMSVTPVQTPWERMVGYWDMCFNDTMPSRFRTGHMMNCGAIGGHVSAVLSFLRTMRAKYRLVSPSARPLMCDMPVVQRAVFEDFHDRVVSGYPFNGKFMHPDAQEVAAVLHKSSLGNDDYSRQMNLPQI